MSDTVFVGGPIFDGVAHQGHTAVGVSDGRIVTMGEEDTVRRSMPAEAEVVDLDGGLLLPGFQDAHLHPMVGGLERLRCDLTGTGTPQECLDEIGRAAARHPTDGWFRGGGWAIGTFGGRGPTAEDLDQVLPDRPALIPSSDHHDAWVNTRALEIAGITADTPDPPDGWFERDERGRPTGTVREAAIAMVGDHVTTTRDDYAAAMREAQSHLHQWGVTGWHDALIGGYAGLDDPTQAYLDLLARDELTAWVCASQWWDRHQGTNQIERLVDERARLAQHGIDAGSVKVMMDGIAETFTATVSSPYLGDTGCPCGDHGLPFVSTEQAQEAVVALDGAGFQVHFHAIGDQAVHDALDAVEAARRTNGMNDLRHQIAHLQLVRPADRRRFRRLGVTANLQGMWAHRATPAVELLLPHLDDERAAWHYPFADILAGGADFAGGSDWPVNPPEPIQAVHVLVNRVAHGSDERPLCPEQGIDLRTALSAYTWGSARANHHPDAGHLVVGGRADLVVLDRDPFDAPAEEIGACEVRAVYASGQQVHP